MLLQVYKFYEEMSRAAATMNRARHYHPERG